MVGALRGGGAETRAEDFVEALGPGWWAWMVNGKLWVDPYRLCMPAHRPCAGEFGEN